MIEEREQWRSRGREIAGVLNAVSELLDKSVSGVRTCWKIENRGGGSEGDTAKLNWIRSLVVEGDLKRNSSKRESEVERAPRINTREIKAKRSDK